MGLLKRTDGGLFTLLPIGLGEGREGLCDGCGLVACVMRKIVQKAAKNRYDAVVAIKSCASFLPIFDFRDTSGMEHRFNTFRLGLAWVSRLKIGDEVALRDKPHDSVFGTAKVTSIHSGTFLEMDSQFGDDNHLAIQAALDGRDFDMGRTMRNLYGTNRFGLDKPTTVIYLERIHA